MVERLFLAVPQVFLRLLIVVFPDHHTGQCKRTGGCYNELVVAFLRSGDGLKGKKSIPVDFMIYL